METPTSFSVETRLERDGVLTLTGLPFRAGDRLVVQIGSVPNNGVRRFPMRGRSYQYTDPFEPAIPPDEWEASR
jgi:hypothetical protein